MWRKFKGKEVAGHVVVSRVVVRKILPKSMDRRDWHGRRPKERLRTSKEVVRRPRHELCGIGQENL